MDYREQGLEEIKTRLTAIYTALGLKELAYIPDAKVGKDKMPAILIFRGGTDEISKRATRGRLGYPCYRTFETWIECWDLSSGDVLNNIYKEARKAILANDGVLVDNKVSLIEIKTLGPYDCAIKGVEGMRGQFEMLYVDQGPI